MNALVVIDDGQLETKVVFQHDGGVERFAFPSRVVMGFAEIAGGEVEGADVYFVDQQIEPALTEIFTVYGVDHPLSVDCWSDGFPTSKLNRVLVHHALVLTDIVGKVEVVTTLPDQDFHAVHDGEALNQPLISAKNANISAGCWRRDEKTGEGEEPSYVIASTEVCPEGIHAIYDLALGSEPDEAQIRAFQDQYFSERCTIVVINIGGRSTRVTLATWVPEVLNAKVNSKRSRTIELGVMTVAALVRDAVEQKFGQRLLAAQVLDLLPKKALTVAGVHHDLSAIVSEATEVVASKIKTELDRIVEENAPLGLMVFCGGGGALFKSLSSAYPADIVGLPENPSFACAAGIMKYLMLFDPSGEGAA